jgi:integrase
MEAERDATQKSSMRIYSFNLDNHILPEFGAIPYVISTARILNGVEAAVDRRWISENPAHRIRIRETDSKREPRFYRPAEIRLLLEKLADPCRAMVAIAVLTRLRIGEILALRWKRVDPLAEALEVAETYSSGGFGLPKARSSRRIIPMSATLVGIFKQLRSPGFTPGALVFCTLKGTPLNPRILYNRELAPACEAIGEPGVSLGFWT